MLKSYQHAVTEIRRRLQEENVSIAIKHQRT